MIRRPPRSTQSRSSAASDVYKRQGSGDLGPAHTVGPAGLARHLRQPAYGANPGLAPVRPTSVPAVLHHGAAADPASDRLLPLTVGHAQSADGAAAERGDGADAGRGARDDLWRRTAARHAAGLARGPGDDRRRRRRAHRTGQRAVLYTSYA